MQAQRFQISKSESPKKPWVVEDTSAPRYEDPVLYRFSSKRKAQEFVAMLESEQRR